MNHELIMILYLLQESRFDTRNTLCRKIFVNAKCALNKCSNCPLEFGRRDFKEKYCQTMDCTNCVLLGNWYSSPEDYPNLIVKTSQSLKGSSNEP